MSDPYYHHHHFKANPGAREVARQLRAQMLSKTWGEGVQVPGGTHMIDNS